MSRIQLGLLHTLTYTSKLTFNHIVHYTCISENNFVLFILHMWRTWEFFKRWSQLYIKWVIFLLDLHELLTTSIFRSKSYGKIYFFPWKLFDRIMFSDLRQKFEINFVLFQIYLRKCNYYYSTCKPSISQNDASLLCFNWIK